MNMYSLVTTTQWKDYEIQCDNKNRFSCTLRTGHSARTQILLKLLWFHRMISSLTLKRCVKYKSFDFFSRRDRSFIWYVWMEILTKSMFKVHPKKYSIEKDGFAFWMWQVSLSQMESSNTRNKPFEKKMEHTSTWAVQRKTSLINLKDRKKRIYKIFK